MLPARPGAVAGIESADDPGKPGVRRGSRVMAQSQENSGRPELLVALAAFLMLVGAAVALMRTNLQTALIPVGFALAATVVLILLWVKLRRVRNLAETQSLAVDTQRRESERNQQA